MAGAEKDDTNVGQKWRFIEEGIPSRKQSALRCAARAALRALPRGVTF